MGAAGVAGITLYLFIDKVVSHVADPSLIGHSDSLLENIPFLITHPFGYGLGMVGPRALNYSSDAILVESFFLLLAIESGILVMLLFGALLVYLFQGGLRARTLDGFLPAALIAASVVSFTVLPTLQEGPVAYTLWILCGMGVVAARAEGAASPADAGRSAAPAPVDPYSAVADAGPTGSGVADGRRAGTATAELSGEGDAGSRRSRRALRSARHDGA
jgi:hypothetical protein